MRGLVLAGAVAGLAPTLAALGPVRAALTPAVLPGGFSGVGRPGHVALTFDDGPDRASTPRFLSLLAERDVRATFFLLGRHALEDVGLVRETVAAGHEVAVHGWDHRCVVLRRHPRLRRELARTRALLEDVAGQPVRWYRPPYGVASTESLLAARGAGLTPVLWTAWGRDWEARATPDSVVRTVTRDLRPGGTVLLHDSDRTSAPDSWRTTLRATEVLLDRWRDDGLGVGTLGEHLAGGGVARGGSASRLVSTWAGASRGARRYGGGAVRRRGW